MDFNFYWTVSDQKYDESTMTELMQELENLLLDWQNFFNLYSQFAPPPEQNKQQIKTWFRELKQQHQKAAKLYNKLSGNTSQPEPTQPDMSEFFKHIQQQVRQDSEKKKDEGPDTMYG